MEKILIITGPTASGKSKLAEEIFKKYDAVIINADSRQIYRQIPIITDQPCEISEKHRLYGYTSIFEEYSVHQWIKDAAREINNAFAEDKLPILVGGTGLYINAMVEGLSTIPDIDPDIRREVREMEGKLNAEEIHKILLKEDEMSAKNIDKMNIHRMLRALEIIRSTGRSMIEWHAEKYSEFPKEMFTAHALMPGKELLYKKINERFDKITKDGAIEEMETIINENKNINNWRDIHAMKACGALEIIDFIKGCKTFEEASDEAKQSIRKYAKRQITWIKNKMKFANFIHGNPPHDISKISIM